MTDFEWTAANVATLRRMFAAGCSDAEIGLALSTTARAVRGKRRRLGLMSQRVDPYVAAMRRARREHARELAVDMCEPEAS